MILLSSDADDRETHCCPLFIGSNTPIIICYVLGFIADIPLACRITGLKKKTQKLYSYMKKTF